MAEKHYASKRFAEKSQRVLIYVILTVISIIWIFPFFYLIFQSFGKYQSGGIFPAAGEWTFDNYKNLFVEKSSPFLNWWLNTFIIAFFTAALQTIFILMTSYALSRLRFAGRQGIMKLILILGMFPGFLGMLVIYNILELLGLNTSIYSLILVYTIIFIITSFSFFLHHFSNIFFFFLKFFSYFFFKNFIFKYINTIRWTAFIIFSNLFSI